MGTRTVRVRRAPCREETNPHLDGACYRARAEEAFLPARLTFKPSTLYSINIAFDNWRDFRHVAGFPAPFDHMKHTINQMIRQFMHWYLDEHNVAVAYSFYVKMRFWRMSYAMHMNKRLDYDVAQDMKNVNLVNSPALTNF